ncbi:MAG: type IV pili methyl-accepting chemotaxis transducer N-terminal domain-containing protein [Burkholderiales bacterium]|nr:type IV pili methyl-accepting chemotaxis transducer N-terminal domain-containing protein [Burkholderiales bacterium]MDE2453439.1 type IV pili methyl-accepting chemotaxis transducer N-terminal domain-containing protein [Burkholderiales bacterium]
MRRPHTLSGKIGAVGGMLLLTALISIGVTLWLTWKLEGGAAALNEAGRMRMQTWRLAQTLASGDPREVDRLVARFDQSVELLRSGDPARPLFLPNDRASMERFAEVRRAWLDLRRVWGAPPYPPAALAARQAGAFVAEVDAFVSAIESQISRLTSVLNAFQFVLMALALGSALMLMYSAYLFVFAPLNGLQRGLERVGAGDLGARVEVESNDEFGAVALGFNRMARMLQDLYQNLEAKVDEKTLHLEAQRARLAALYEAAALMARATTLTELGRGFAPQVRAVVHADAVAVRWSDESNQRHLMLAADGLPAALVEGEQCISSGDCLCGQGQADTRIIPIRPDSGGVLVARCVKAGFRSVVNVPLRLQERCVGEIDLFYREEPQLAGEDRAVLETLASHLAGAIEGLRLASLARESAVADERGLLASELHDSIAQSLAFLKIQSGLLRVALDGGDRGAVDRRLAELDAGIAESLSDVRELLVHFRTRTNAEDIVPALQLTLQKFEHQTGLKTHLEVEGHGLPLASDQQVQVLHVVQEALSNVRKHAHANAVWVEVQCAPAWRFEVRDDGSGFDAAAGADSSHVGLRIMRERAQRIGARVELDSVPGSGTCVVLTLAPVQETAA